MLALYLAHVPQYTIPKEYLDVGSYMKNKNEMNFIYSETNTNN